MPKVDPTTGEPMSDDPEGPDALRGGKELGDPALEGATETGRSGVGYTDTGSKAGNEADGNQLPGQKGGAAGGGGQAGG